MYDEILLSPKNHALLLIDHQYLQLLVVRSHDAGEVVNNVTALAKAAEIFGVPTMVTSAVAERQAIVKPLADATPDITPIDRTTLNAWEDERVPAWAKTTGRKTLVMAGLLTEICLAMTVLSAISEGYDVFFVPDASGGQSPEAHAMAVQRLVQAGAKPITTWAYVGEVQRDWSDEATGEKVSKLAAERGGGFGQGLQWEWQLLGLKEGTR